MSQALMPSKPFTPPLFVIVGQTVWRYYTTLGRFYTYSPTREWGSNCLLGECTHTRYRDFTHAELTTPEPRPER